MEQALEQQALEQAQIQKQEQEQQQYEEQEKQYEEEEEASEEEQNQLIQLREETRISNEEELAELVAQQQAAPLTFTQKMKGHTGILMAAGAFDIIGLIPVVCVVTNGLFTGILFIYFHTKKGKGNQSELMHLVAPMVLGTLIDWLIGVLPTCLGTTVIRIIKNY